METTLDIRIEFSKNISLAAQSRKISKSEMISILIKEVMDNISKPENIGRMVQYQQRRNKGEWHRIHLYIGEDEYEYFLDLRKILKMSVSLILAYAVEKFFDKLMKSN